MCSTTSGADSQSAEVTSKIDSSVQPVIQPPSGVSATGGGPLYLHIQSHIEYPPGYRHAWGTALVTSDQAGTQPVQVEFISLTISMDSPGGGERTVQPRNNASSTDADVKYYGAVFGSFHCTFFAVARHPGYGEWSVSSNY